MRNKKILAAAAVYVMVIGLTGCAAESETAADHSIWEEVPITEEKEENSTDMQIQGESQAKDPFTAKDENREADQADNSLEEELERYRQEREELIQEANGLVEGGSPNEDHYAFDMSGSFYSGQFDTREITEAFASARIYVTDELKFKPETKMVTYPCVDPRILEIYEDEDKGVAAGYDNDDIFVCEYQSKEGKWQYLILVRGSKESAWDVIHNGSSYKE